MNARHILRSTGLWRKTLVWFITIASSLAAAVIIVLRLDALGGVPLTAGQPAPQDFLAPRPITFTSEVLTARARNTAAAAVADVYDTPDGRAARQQVLLLRDILDFINVIRADALATAEQKLADLMTLRDLPLTAAEAGLILALEEDDWAAVQTEALTVLEQVMRSQVREDQLHDIRRSVPVRLSVDLSDSQSQVVLLLVRPLIVPNSVFNAEATEAQRQAARDAVEPVVRQIQRGQAIVTRGQVVTEEQLEALRVLGLLQPEFDWRTTVSSVLAVLITALLVGIYAQRFNPEIAHSPKLVLLLGLLFNSFLLAAQFLVPGRTVFPYIFPAAALAMLLTVLIGPNLAITVSVALGALVGYIGGGSLELTIYTALGGLVAAATLGRAERVNLFFWAGLVSALAGMGIILVFRLPNPTTDVIGLAQLLAASLINGGLSAAVTLMVLFALGGLFDITTSLQLVELARPDHPLLRFILRNAPGTYQHSLQVANLAEQAAEHIGANAMLIRVAALYHDAGKALHPQYFIENQINGANIHDTLDPVTSAGIIIRHVSDGLELARKYRLPTRIKDFVSEHHGTLKTIYQYNRALEMANGDASRVDVTKFMYPGPRPRSRETAVLMLADGCEAKTRSDRPKTEEDIDRIVKMVIDDRMAKGQLADTDLTLRDLQLIRESFVNTLRGVFHPRVQYPEPPRIEAAVPGAPPAP
jgi:hypothetical protein